MGDKVLAQDTGNGYILFPGGGINEKELPEEGVLRETFEETGAIIKNLTKIGVIYFDWRDDWAKTEKQKLRYNKFRGEEMHLFVGEIERFEKPSGDPEDEWKGDLLSEIVNILKKLESNRPFPKQMEEYHTKQIEIMKNKII